MTDIISGLLKIANQKIVPIIALFLTTGFFVLLQIYEFQPMANWLFIDRMPATIALLFPAAFIFSGILLVLNLSISVITFSKRILDWKGTYISRREEKIIRLFAKTGREALSTDEIMNALGFSIHRFDYLAAKLMNKGYLETDGDQFNYHGPNFWLTQKSRSFLRRRFLL